MSAATSVGQSLGLAVDRTVCAHHRRRLDRIGRLDALDAPAGGWAAGFANLNEHSLSNDTEMNVVTPTPSSSGRLGYGSGPRTSSSHPITSTAIPPG